MKYGWAFSVPSGSPRSLSFAARRAQVSVAIASSIERSTLRVSSPRASENVARDGTWRIVVPDRTVRPSSYEMSFGRKTARKPNESIRYTSTGGIEAVLSGGYTRPYRNVYCPERDAPQSQVTPRQTPQLWSWYDCASLSCSHWLSTQSVPVALARRAGTV